MSSALDRGETPRRGRLFCASLGLNDAFACGAVCAVGDALARRSGCAGQKGWGFSLDDMARPSLRNLEMNTRGTQGRTL